MQKTLYDGRQLIVGILMPSDMFGRVFSSTSNVSIEAATDVTLCCYSRAGFESLLLQFPALWSIGCCSRCSMSSRSRRTGCCFWAASP
ncbi:cyclic nucleotide-binding domain-containing protein [Mesorhizobium xinjiangense]|uniref:cyclic nucleotide-binding domain-containing protein n=1 Tax=Mesorhizobium xinjiangense TaxID=2678685 RepID=UPI002E258BD8